MRRRDFLKAIGACAVCAVPGAMWAIGPEEQTIVRPGTAPNPAHGKRPNVILVLCDDLGWGDLGAFWQNKRAEAGSVHIDTPNLDDAMRRGVMLTNAYTTSPVCAPARASMVSGKHQGHCNLRDNMFDRPVDAHMTIGTVMKQAGYATWHIGKWGIGGGYESGGQPRRSMACDAGFDYSYGYPAHAHGHSFYHWAQDEGSWRTSKGGSPVVENVSKEMYDAGRYLNLSRGYDDSIFEQDSEGTYYRRQIANTEVRYCYDTDLFTAKIKQLIDNHLTNGDKSQPFFCYACYTTVHGAGSKNNQGDATLSSVEDFHVPGRAYPALDDTDKRWGGGVTWEKDKNGYLPFKEGVEGGDNTSNTYIYPEYEGYVTASQRRYATNVRRLDDALGDLLHFLKVRGLAEDTLFIFTSDNGPAGEYLGPTNGLLGRLNVVEGNFDSNGPFATRAVCVSRPLSSGPALSPLLRRRHRERVTSPSSSPRGWPRWPTSRVCPSPPTATACRFCRPLWARGGSCPCAFTRSTRTADRATTGASSRWYATATTCSSAITASMARGIFTISRTMSCRSTTFRVTPPRPTVCGG